MGDWLFFLRRRKVFVDFILVLALIICSIWAAQQYINGWGGKPEYYQTYFAPTVMETCGRGHFNVDLSQAPKLQQFLNYETMEFSCADIPEDITTFSTHYTGVNPYFFNMFSWVWKLTGEISWTNLHFMFYILYSISTVSAYGIFRFLMNKYLAYVFALFMCFSAIQLQALPHIRDYSKAPFILLITFIIIRLITKSSTNSQLYILSLIAGVITGIGLGFRTDLLIMVPAFFVCLFVFMPDGIKSNLLRKGAAVCIFGAGFFLAGFPIIDVIFSGGNTFHVILLGIVSVFDSHLGVLPSPVYEWGYLYNDTFINTVVNSYANRTADYTNMLNLATSEYDHYGGAFYIEILRNFPSDILTRYYGSALQILNLPFYYGRELSGVSQGSVLSLVVNLRGVLLQWLTGTGLLVGFVSLLFTAKIQVKYAIALAFYVLFFVGYPSLQFSERHYFHLEFVSLGLLGFLITIMFKTVKNIQAQRNSKRLFSIKEVAFAWWKPVAVVVSMALFLILSNYSLRWYQVSHLKDMFSQYESAEQEEVKIVPKQLDGNYVELSTPEFSYSGKAPIETEYLVLEFDKKQNDSLPIEVRFDYSSNSPFNNLTTTRMVSFEASDRWKLMFPIYSAPFSTFNGIVMKEDMLPYLSSVKRFTNTKKFPLLIGLSMPENWRDKRLYQKLGYEKEITNGTYTYPKNLDKDYSPVINEPFDHHLINYRVPIFNQVDEEWHVKGDVLPIDRGDYLAATSPILRERGQALIVSGTLVQGGLTLGFVEDGIWGSSVHVTEKGDFQIILPILSLGNYRVILANHLDASKNYNEFVINEIGWYTPKENDQ